MNFSNFLCEETTSGSEGLKTSTVIIIAVIALIVIAIVMVLILKSKTKVQPRVNEVLQQKSDEVAGLKLDVEKEKLQNELNEMKAPKHFYCKYCGAKNDINATRCSKCGVGVEEFK